MPRAHLAAGPQLALGSPTAEITAGELAEALETLVAGVQAAAARRVLLVPPDRTRLASRAGDITAALYRLLLRLGIAVDVMPALGTHRPMDDADCDAMSTARSPRRSCDSTGGAGTSRSSARPGRRVTSCRSRSTAP